MGLLVRMEDSRDSVPKGKENGHGGQLAVFFQEEMSLDRLSNGWSIDQCSVPSGKLPVTIVHIHIEHTVWQ